MTDLGPILAHDEVDCRPIGPDRRGNAPVSPREPPDPDATAVGRPAVTALGGAGGLSGASFWQIRTQRGLLCLRGWPEAHPTPERLAWIHAVLRHVASQGFALVPLPIATRHGTTVVRHANRLWQLEPWLPGEAEPAERASREKLRAALVTLARFHEAARSYATDGATTATRSPGVAQRQRRLHEMARGGIDRLQAAVDLRVRPDLATLAGRLLALLPGAVDNAARQLDAVSRLPVELQPCLRDIWNAHVLYQGPRVSGLVDFGAMRIETVAVDLARLVGSMAGNDPAAWREALAAYESIRGLTEPERSLIGPLDASGLALGAVHWIEWLYVDQRRFDDQRAVRNRLDAIAARLTDMALRIVV